MEQFARLGNSNNKQQNIILFDNGKKSIIFRKFAVIKKVKKEKIMYIGQITHTIGLEKYNLDIESVQYTDNNLGVVIIDQKDRFQFTVLSTNIPKKQHLLENDSQFFAKTWSENQQIANQLRNSQFFKDTGRRVDINFVTAEVWEIITE